MHSDHRARDGTAERPDLLDVPLRHGHLLLGDHEIDVVDISRQSLRSRRVEPDWLRRVGVGGDARRWRGSAVAVGIHGRTRRTAGHHDATRHARCGVTRDRTQERCTAGRDIHHDGDGLAGFGRGALTGRERDVVRRRPGVLQADLVLPRCRDVEGRRREAEVEGGDLKALRCRRRGRGRGSLDRERRRERRNSSGRGSTCAGEQDGADDDRK